MIALVVLTDGRRDCLTRTLASAFEHLDATFAVRLLHDDSGDADHHQWLAEHYSASFDRIVTHERRLGQDHAIRFVRDELAAAHQHIPFRYVFWLEDDFVFHADINLAQLAHILDHHAQLLQLALRRQPWFPGERAAGGIIERDPDAYTEMHDGPFTWLEHRLWFTHNPNLQRASLLAGEYPLGKRHEWRYSRELAADPAVRFGYWGTRDAVPLVEHIGVQRVGVRY